MNRIFKYYKNCKGITLVLMALMLAVLLMLAGLAIDIAYMYYVKNQLQVAADASSLAGAAQLSPALDSGSAYTQLTARQEAWKFACKNSAAGQNVYLVNGEITDKKGKVIGLRSCVDADIPADLNNNNSENGDIVVGHWRSTNDVACQTTWESAGSGFFCRANGNTGLTINALKARPRRTSETPGMPRVSLFIGQIFSLIGADWSAMSARASAIASGGPLPVGPFPLCIQNCGMATSLTTVSPNLTPGTRFQLKKNDGPPFSAWTSFLDNDTSATNVSKYVLGTKIPPPVCNQCIYTTQGLVNPTICDLRTRIKNSGANYTLTAGGNTYTIFGWKVLIPILPLTTSCPTAKGSGCPGDPGYQPGDPYPVIQYAEAIITDGVPEGNCPHDPGPFASGPAGIVMVGTGVPELGIPPGQIGCFDCANPPASVSSTVKLVK